MKFVNINSERRLYLLMREAVECGFKEKSLREAKSRGVKCWDLIDDPDDLRRVLVGYEALKDWQKKMVKERFGDPYDYVARTPILNMVNQVENFEASTFFRKHTYSSVTDNCEKFLPPEVVTKYIRADKWLRMLKEVREDRLIVKKDLGISLADFYKHVGELICLEKERGKVKGYVGLDMLPGDFPYFYQNLLERVTRYITEGYQGIINPLYGNKIAAKIGKVTSTAAANMELNHTLTIADTQAVITPNRGQNGEKALIVAPNNANKEGAFALDQYEEQMAAIRHCASLHNNLNAAQVTKMANILFQANGWETVKIGTVRRIISENKHVLTAGRQGVRKHRSTIEMQMKRKAPDHPLLYWTLDGWTVELSFKERTSKGMEYKRLVMVVVLDAFNKYPVGFAIGERENADLIRMANRNALNHIKELFGDYYRPWQVQSDHYATKQLTPLYQAMAHHYTPAAVGNAKAKIIEPYFKYLNTNYCQLAYNWSGYGVKSRDKNQVNIEKVDKIKNTFPDKAGLIQQICEIMQRERALKHDIFFNAVRELLDNKGAYQPEVMTDMDRLMAVGKPINGKTNRIEGQGLEKQFQRQTYLYDSFDPQFRAHRHIDWMIIGDEEDMTKVLAVSPDSKLRFVLEQKRVVPMDTWSATEEDRLYRKQVQSFNDAREHEITELYGRDADMTRELVERSPLQLDDQAEMDVKLMLTRKGQQKERLQDANGLKAAQRKDQKRIAEMEQQQQAAWLRMQEDYMAARTDFSAFDNQ